MANPSFPTNSLVSSQNSHLQLNELESSAKPIHSQEKCEKITHVFSEINENARNNSSDLEPKSKLVADANKENNIFNYGDVKEKGHEFEENDEDNDIDFEVDDEMIDDLLNVDELDIEMEIDESDVEKLGINLQDYEAFVKNKNNQEYFKSVKDNELRVQKEELRVKSKEQQIQKAEQSVQKEQLKTQSNKFSGKQREVKNRLNQIETSNVSTSQAQDIRNDIEEKSKKCDKRGVRLITTDSSTSRKISKSSNKKICDCNKNKRFFEKVKNGDNLQLILREEDVDEYERHPERFITKPEKWNVSILIMSAEEERYISEELDQIGLLIIKLDRLIEEKKEEKTGKEEPGHHKHESDKTSKSEGTDKKWQAELKEKQKLEQERHERLRHLEHMLDEQSVQRSRAKQKREKTATDEIDRRQSDRLKQENLQEEIHVYIVTKQQIEAIEKKVGILFSLHHQYHPHHTHRARHWAF